MAERCEVCQFEWDSIAAEMIGGRLRTVADGFRGALDGDPTALLRRPAPDTWSVVEYGCHVRDVLLNLRDRVVVGLAEDNPTPKAMFADVRIANGLYATDRPTQLADEISMAAALLTRTVDALDDVQLGRPIFYGWPRPDTRTILWVAAQALHEAEHHLDDVRRIAATG